MVTATHEDMVIWKLYCEESTDYDDVPEDEDQDDLPSKYSLTARYAIWSEPLASLLQSSSRKGPQDTLTQNCSLLTSETISCCSSQSIQISKSSM
jgi:hypothetical protein